MKKYLIAVVMSAVLALGMLVYGLAVAVPVAAQFNPLAPHVTCRTTCTQDIIINGRVIVPGTCTTICQ